MSDLTSLEKLRLEVFLGMKTGYVLNFSNQSFADFVLEHTHKEIYSAQSLYGEGSKANRLRSFWTKEPNFLVGRLILAMLEKWKGENEIYGYYVSSDEWDSYHACVKIAERLKQDVQIDHIDAIDGEDGDKDFSLLAASIRDTIEKNQPEVALDRLHTYVTKYIRRLCENHNVASTKEAPLHSIFGKYVKTLKANHALTDMSERILKTSISILDAFNDVRNNMSFAHDNQILNYRESLLISNNVINTIKFIRSIEDEIKKEEDLPF